MLLPQQLDVDQLHTAAEVILSGKYRYRQEGKTVAYLYLMLGEMQLAYINLGPRSPRFLYVGENRQMARDVCKTMGELLRQEDLEDEMWYHCVDRIELKDGRMIQFTGVDQIESAVRGNRYDRVFFDVDNASRVRLRAEGKLTSIEEQLRCSLHPYGDLI